MNLADLPNVNIEEIEKFKEIAGNFKRLFNYYVES